MSKKSILKKAILGFLALFIVAYASIVSNSSDIDNSDSNLVTNKILKYVDNYSEENAECLAEQDRLNADKGN